MEVILTILKTVGIIVALVVALFVLAVIVRTAIIAPRVMSFIGTFIVVWYFSGYFYTEVGTGIKLAWYVGISEFMLSVYTGVGAGMLAALLCHMVIRARKLSADKRAQELNKRNQERALEEQKNRVVGFLEHCCSHAKLYESHLQKAEDHLNKRQAFPFWEALEECGNWVVFSPASDLSDWGAYASYEGLSNKLKIRIHNLYNRAIADNEFAIIHQQRETNALLHKVVGRLQTLVVNTHEIANNTAAAAASLASMDEHVFAMKSDVSAMKSDMSAIKRTSAKAASGISDLKAIAGQQVDATRAQGRGDNLKI